MAQRPYLAAISDLNARHILCLTLYNLKQMAELSNKTRPTNPARMCRVLMRDNVRPNVGHVRGTQTGSTSQTGERGCNMNTAVCETKSEPSTKIIHSFCSLDSSTQFWPSLRPTTSVSDELHHLNSRTTTDAINNVTDEIYRTRDRCRKRRVGTMIAKMTPQENKWEMKLILAGQLTDNRFLIITTSMHLFMYLLHLSTCFEHQALIIRRSKCINTSSGMISLCKWLLGMPVRREPSWPAYQAVTYTD